MKTKFVNKVIFFSVVLVLAALCFTACSSFGTDDSNSQMITTGEIGVIEDTDLGSVYMNLSIEEFESYGFTPGDSINIAFDNGFTLTDIPYYDGYYTRAGEALACSYPGYEYVAIARTQGNSVWVESGSNADTKIIVTLNEKGKYLATQEAFSLVYSNERDDFESNEIFSNFRALAGGNLKDNLFFRSASPIDDTNNRAECTCNLLEQSGIEYVMNLADSAEEIEEFKSAQTCDTSYYENMISDGKVFLLNLMADYKADEYKTKVAASLKAVCEKKGTCLIHCLEGKDRTGFVCALILALADATNDEIIDDYMITYENYYGVTLEKAPESYAVIKSVKAEDYLYYLAGIDESESLDGISFVSGAENYLKEGGLNDEDIAMIKNVICK